MSSSKALLLSSVLSLVACADDSPGASSNDPSDVPASATTRAALGVDHWVVSLGDDGGRPVITVAGYDGDSAVRARVAWRKGESQGKEWIDFAVGTEPPATLRFEPDTVPAGQSEFAANEAATKVAARLKEDLGASSSLTTSSAELRPRTQLTSPGQPLTHAQYMTLCLSSPYHSMTYAQCNAMFSGS